jgi:aspartate ammonia-lyase
MRTREVSDTLGPISVPEDAYYGAQTARALVNFPLSGLRPHPEFIRALAAVKLAAAHVNGSLGLLSPEQAGAITGAAREVFEGHLRDQFVVDVFNAGAGTSQHMNCNEVIASRASEILGGSRGDASRIHPNDHVNLGQSTNDVVPTAIRLSGLVLALRLADATDALAASLAKKASEFDDVVKSGRTHLQDAVPVRLGQEFGGYATSIRRAGEGVRGASDALREIGLGGSAVGTGLNTHPQYRRLAVERLGRLYGLNLRPADDLFEAMASSAPAIRVISAARALAIELLRITNDLRLLASGPRTGLAEIHLPAVQPGSSIMPGKVNPVIPESTAMVCYHVIGCDAAIAAAGAAGQLELNVMMPVIAFDLLFALEILANAVTNLRLRCVEGIRADPDRCRAYAETSVAIATILNPVIGYEKAAGIVKRAIQDGIPIRRALEESGIVTAQEIDRIFDLRRWTEPGLLERFEEGGATPADPPPPERPPSR